MYKVILVWSKDYTNNIEFLNLGLPNTKDLLENLRMYAYDIDVIVCNNVSMTRKPYKEKNTAENFSKSTVIYRQ